MISLGCDIKWPPKSPDLAPNDFWFWGPAQEVVRLRKPTTFEQLKDCLDAHVVAVNARGEPSRAVQSTRKRAQLCLEMNGGHFEHLLKKRKKNVQANGDGPDDLEVEEENNLEEDENEEEIAENGDTIEENENLEEPEITNRELFGLRRTIAVESQNEIEEMETDEEIDFVVENTEEVTIENFESESEEEEITFRLESAKRSYDEGEKLYQRLENLERDAKNDEEREEIESENDSELEEEIARIDAQKPIKKQFNFDDFASSDED